MNIESVAAWIGIVAGITTILTAIWGINKLVTRSSAQKQHLQGGAVGIQSGRDINIGLSNEQKKSTPRK